MSVKSLDPKFRKHVEEALAEVATTEIGEITAQTELAELGLDSISWGEMIIILEEKIDVTIEPEEMEQLKTFGDLQELVERLTA